MLFCGICDQVVAQTEVKRKPARELPIVFTIDAPLVIAGAKEATLGADAVVVDETGEQFRDLVAGKIAISDLEVAFPGNRAEVGNIAADYITTELEGMMPAIDRERVDNFIHVFWYGIETVVARVLELVLIAPDKGTAAKLRIAVRIDDSQVCGDWLIGKDRGIGKRVAVISDPKLVQ